MTLTVSGYEQKYAEARGLRFSYLEWGRRGAPVMVLLHGLTSHAHSWDVLASAFQDGYHIFALDQRGHGETQWPDPPSYTTDDYVEDLAALVRIWGIERFALIGLSMGAHNSLAFTARHPGRVEKLVAIDIWPARPAAAGPREPAEPPPMVFDSVEDMVTRMRETNRIASDGMIRYRVEHNARQLPDGRWTYKYSPDAPRLWQPADLWQEIRAVACPTLIVRGSESNVLAAEVAEKEAAAIPNAGLVTVPGSGHPVPLDRPEELEREVRAFLAS